MSNGQYPSAPKDLWPLVSWQTQAPVIGTEQFWQPGAVGEILQETRHRGHEGELCCIVGLPPVGLQPGLPFVLTAVAPKKKKKCLFLWQPSLCLLGCWRGARPQRRVFGFAASSQATVPICLCSKLLTFNGLTGLC